MGIRDAVLRYPSERPSHDIAEDLSLKKSQKSLIRDDLRDIFGSVNETYILDVLRMSLRTCFS